METHNIIQIDPKVVEDAVSNISNALKRIDGTKLQIDFIVDSNNLTSIVDYIDQNNLVYIPLVEQFEINLVNALNSMLKSIDIYEQMNSDVAKALSEGSTGTDKFSLL